MPLIPQDASMAKNIFLGGHPEKSRRSVAIEGGGAFFRADFDRERQIALVAAYNIKSLVLPEEACTQLPEDVLRLMLRIGDDNWHYTLGGQSATRQEVVDWISGGEKRVSSNGNPPKNESLLQAESIMQGSEPKRRVWVRISTGASSYSEANLPEGWTRTIRHDAEGVHIVDEQNKSS